MVVVKMVALILSLGMDTLMMSISLGVAMTPGKAKLALTFAGAEGLMTLIGLVIGQRAGQLIGNWASVMGGVALSAVAIWLIFFNARADEEEYLERQMAGWTLMVTAVSISVDELAVGFSIGLEGVPVALTVVLIALQAFLLTILGLAMGSRLKRYLGEWTEQLAGVVLGLLGVWILIEALVRLLHH